jgi:hypothetical protein
MMHSAEAKRAKDLQLIKYFQMFGFLNNRCRNDLKRFNNERSIKRNPASQTPLIDFANEHPEIFDCLWAIFALQPSNSRPSEQFHGMERHAHYDQTCLGHSNARGRYMMLQEYFRRKAHRERTIQRSKDKSKPLQRRHCDNVRRTDIRGCKSIQKRKN